MIYIFAILTSTLQQLEKTVGQHSAEILTQQLQNTNIVDRNAFMPKEAAVSITTETRV